MCSSSAGRLEIQEKKDIFVISVALGPSALSHYISHYSVYIFWLPWPSVSPSSTKPVGQLERGERRAERQRRAVSVHN